MSFVSYCSKGLKIVGGISFAAAFIAAQAVTDAFVTNETLGYFNKKPDNQTNEDSVDITTYASLAVMAVAAVPLAITVTRSLYNKLNELFHTHHDHDHDHDHDYNYNHDDHHHGHHHSWKQELGELLLIGGPFILVTFGGSYFFFDKLFGPKIKSKMLHKGLNISISSFLGLISGLGNWALHGEHFHAQEGVIQLFRQIDSNLKRLKAVTFGASILAGHFLQGFLDSKLFFKSIGLESQAYEVLSKKALVFGLTSGFSLFLGLMIAAIEGHTEVRSMLLNESTVITDEQLQLITYSTPNPKSILLFTKIFLGVASAIHAWQPTLAIPEFTNSFLELLNLLREKNKQNLLHGVQEWPLWSVILIFAVSAVVIGVPNAYGIFNTAKNACNETFQSVAKTMGKVGFFVNCTREKQQSLLGDFEDNDEETSINSILHQQYQSMEL